MSRAFIYDAIRTPRGLAKDTGALNQASPLDLLKTLFKGLEQRNQFNPEMVEDVILGCVTQLGEQGGNVARAAVLYAGWPDVIGGMTINRFCSSSLDAVAMAAERIKAGSCDTVVAGGVESMSRVQAFSDKPAWMLDPQLSVKTRAVPIGIGADLVATLNGYQRRQLDGLAQQSQQRAANAQQHGHFSKSLLPVTLKDGTQVTQDEGIRGDISVDKLSALAPLFSELGAKGIDQALLSMYPQLSEVAHPHTVASAPSMVDAASMVLVSSDSLQQQGVKPRAEILGYKTLCGSVTEVLTGGIDATQALLDEQGLTVDDIELVEYNESYAAPTLLFMEKLGLSPDIVNVNGGAMALGHPMGATGGVLLSMLLDELERTDKQLGLVAICGATGSGSAMLVRRC